MTPVFDEDGLATQAGDIVCYYYDELTGEYQGWSDEYINVGVSMPGNSTATDPGEEVKGKVFVYRDDEWKTVNDYRGSTVYSTVDGSENVVDYIGDVKDGFVMTSPKTPFDDWDGSQWVTNTDSKHAADVNAAEQQRAKLLADAQTAISIWQSELQLNLISESDKYKLISWLHYIKELRTLDTSVAPTVIWPVQPEN